MSGIALDSEPPDTASQNPNPELVEADIPEPDWETWEPDDDYD